MCGWSASSKRVMPELCYTVRQRPRPATCIEARSIFKYGYSLRLGSGDLLGWCRLGGYADSAPSRGTAGPFLCPSCWHGADRAAAAGAPGHSRAERGHVGAGDWHQPSQPGRHTTAVSLLCDWIALAGLADRLRVRGGQRAAGAAEWRAAGAAGPARRVAADRRSNDRLAHAARIARGKTKDQGPRRYLVWSFVFRLSSAAAARRPRSDRRSFLLRHLVLGAGFRHTGAGHLLAGAGDPPDRSRRGGAVPAVAARPAGPAHARNGGAGAGRSGAGYTGLCGL